MFSGIETHRCQRCHTFSGTVNECSKSLRLLLFWKTSDRQLWKHGKLFIRIQLASTFDKFTEILYSNDWKYAKATLLSRFQCGCFEFGNILFGRIENNWKY